MSQNELQPIRFQGQHFDTETGLHYNRFRYYDPDLGMFTSRDPIGLMGGDNVFAYAPNPTGWIDPLGLAAGATDALSKAATGAKAAAKIGRGVPGVIWQAVQPTTMGDATFYPTDAQIAAAAGAAAKAATDKPCTSGNCCPPCKPYPEGTIGYIGPRRVQHGRDGSRSNGGIGIPHYKIFVVTQDKRDCSCNWQHTRACHQLSQMTQETK